MFWEFPFDNGAGLKLQPTTQANGCCLPEQRLCMALRGPLSDASTQIDTQLSGASQEVSECARVSMAVKWLR